MKPKRFFSAFLCVAFLLLNGCIQFTGTSIPAKPPVDSPSAPDILKTPQATLATPMVTLSLSYPYPAPYPNPTSSGPYPPPEPKITPTFGITPTFSPSPTATVTATSTPTFTATATFLPYTGKPFTLIFIRDGNLWLAEIGGRGERQLTHEPQGWYVSNFDVNPRGDRIAYVSWKGSLRVVDGMIKQVNLGTGKVSPVLGEGDVLIEGGVKWLGDSHLAYDYVHWYATGNSGTGVVTTPDVEFGMYPYFYFIIDLTTGETNHNIRKVVDISQSPDGRYWVTCIAGYPYEPNCEFVLYDLSANQSWPVAQETGWGWFLGWSPDSQWMIFSNRTSFYASETDHKFFIVNSITRLGKWVILPEQSGGSIRWSSKSDVIAYSGCEVGREFKGEIYKEEGCQIQFWNPDGTQIKKSIPLPERFGIISWTPDDTRLVLQKNAETLWIINVDGSGLRSILGGVMGGIVLSDNGD